MKTLSSDGTELSYDVTGTGPVLLLVHGITESSETWAPVASLLAEGHTVARMDLRGHGLSGDADAYDLVSMATDVGAVLAALGADDAVLVGHSLGGAVVSAYAAGGPCAGVINVDQPLQLSAFQAVLASFEAQLRGTTVEFEGVMTAILDQMAGPLDGPERERVAAIRRPRQGVVLAIWDVVLTATPAELDATVNALAGAITTPYLSLHGIDPGDHYARWLRELVPSSNTEVWVDHGHYPHLLAPDRFVRRVREFVRSIS